MSTKQPLVASILDFLSQSIADGTVRADDREGLEVAIQCIGEAFNVDPSDRRQIAALSVNASLESIFHLYLQTHSKVGGGPSSTPAPEDREQADIHKQRGNSLMALGKYEDAIQSYSRAVDLDPTNPIYYSNRAAACSNKGDHLAAVGDAEKAISLDPKYIKSYHRLGFAYWGLDDHGKAIEAYTRGLEHDPQNESLLQALKDARDRVAAASEANVSEQGQSPSGFSPSMLDSLGKIFGGGLQPPGIPDMSALANNPQLRSVAQELATSGGMDKFLTHPGVRRMMARMHNGDMPSMEDIINDPDLKDLTDRYGIAKDNRPGTNQ